MSQAGYIAMGIFFGVFAIAMVLIVRRRLKDVKVEDANIPGQINEIIRKVVNDASGYKAVPARSKQSATSMFVETLRDKALSKLTGHYIFTYKPDQNFVLIYGNMQMFFVPIYEKLHTKEIKADLETVTQVSLEDVKKVKSNGSYSSITLVYKEKGKFYFGTLNEFFFKGASAQDEKEQFAEFMRDFENAVNNK